MTVEELPHIGVKGILLYWLASVEPGENSLRENYQRMKNGNNLFVNLSVDHV